MFLDQQLAFNPQSADRLAEVVRIVSKRFRAAQVSEQFFKIVFTWSIRRLREHGAFLSLFLALSEYHVGNHRERELC